MIEVARRSPACPPRAPPGCRVRRPRRRDRRPARPEPAHAASRNGAGSGFPCSVSSAVTTVAEERRGTDRARASARPTRRIPPETIGHGLPAAGRPARARMQARAARRGAPARGRAAPCSTTSSSKSSGTPCSSERMRQDPARRDAGHREVAVAIEGDAPRRQDALPGVEVERHGVRQRAVEVEEQRARAGAALLERGRRIHRAKV